MRTKLKAFALVFERLRGAVADTPIHELLYMMLDETGFTGMHRPCRQENGADRI